MASSPMKVGRVKVGVRCRPAFQDEIDFAKGEFLSIVDTRAEAINDPSLGQLSLTLMSGKQREFLYDYVFGSSSTQDQVYSTIAQPVVADVLKGFNGTIFAYGQTGTGKTYTMGILEFISNEHAGIIPRAVAQIFHHVERQHQHHPEHDIVISLSFLQLYRETIQDLLAPANGNAISSDDNLVIREDPQRGFYVEGLQEFAVRNYHEAEALINLGLENRAIAPTLMNATSSRSHTVLTINIEQRLPTEALPQTPKSTSSAGGSSFSSRSNSSVNLAGMGSNPRKGAQYTKTLRSKLLMVDLAGSERVRRTVSKGARLSEAKSINTSLSALGNVIAALAEANVGHIPYRDSKLTRLLQDSLGGTARTALIATVGPAAVNYGETLSTLLFATRCMAVKTVPVQHAEVDYAEMCAALQAKLNEMEGLTTQRLLGQQEDHEKAVRELRNQLELERSAAAQHQLAIAAHSRDAAKAAFSSELRTLLEQIDRVRRGKHAAGSAPLDTWLSKPVGFKLADSSGSLEGVPVEAQQAQLLGYCFEIISQLSGELSGTLRRNAEREELAKLNLSDEFSAQERLEAQRLREKASMDAEDPRNRNSSNSSNRAGSGKAGESGRIGSHLAPMSHLDALRRVEGQYRSNNAPVATTTGPGSTQSAGWTDQAQLLTQPIGAPVVVEVRPSLFNYQSMEEVCAALTSMHAGIRENLASVKSLLARKDAHYQNVKEALTLQLVEKRKREEEVINWSYILKYLLSSASKLRRQSIKGQQNGEGGEADGALEGPAQAFPAGLKLGGGIMRQALEGVQPAMHSRQTRQVPASSSVQSSSELDDSELSPTDSDHRRNLRSSSGDGGFPHQRTGTGGVSKTSSHLSGIAAQQQNQYGQQQYEAPLPLPPRARSSSRGRGSSYDSAAPSSSAPQYQRSLPSPSLSSVGSQQHGFGIEIPDSAAVSPPYSGLDDDHHSLASSIQTHSTRRSQQAPSRGSSQQQLQEAQFGRLAQSYPPPPAAARTPRLPPRDLYPQPAFTPYASASPEAPFPHSASSRREPRNDYATPHMSTAQPQQRAPASGSSSHSRFAQGVVQDLGVDTHQATAAMSVIDKVAQITDAQLAQLDPATRNQILQIRSELGLGAPPSAAPASLSASSSGRSASARRPPTPGALAPKRSATPPTVRSQQPGIKNAQHYSGAAAQGGVRDRASSAPRQRSTSASSTASLSLRLPQHQPGYLPPASGSTPTFGRSSGYYEQDDRQHSRSHNTSYLDDDEDDDGFSQLDML